MKTGPDNSSQILSYNTKQDKELPEHRSCDSLAGGAGDERAEGQHHVVSKAWPSGLQSQDQAVNDGGQGWCCRAEAL